MKRSYILKAILTVFLFYTVLQTTVVPVNSWFENYSVDISITNEDPPIYVYSDSVILDYEYLYPILPSLYYDAPYGFTYNFTTNPSCDITVYAMTKDDYIAWRAHESHTKKTLEQDETTGAGKYRFNKDTQWAIIFWNTDSNTPTTIITFTVTIEKVLPIGMIIGFSIAGIVLIAIVVSIVVSSRRKSDYITKTDSGLTDYRQIPVVSAPSISDQTLFEKANTEFQKGNVKQAIFLWEQILSKSSDFYPVMCNLAMAHISQGNNLKAIEYLNQALAIKHDYQPALDLLDIAKSKQGDLIPTDKDTLT